jgi:hypothetical protein
VNAIQIRTKESDCWKTRTPKQTDSCDVRESPGLIWKNGTQKEVFGEKEISVARGKRMGFLKEKDY